ncbi:alanine:cation symporter family protein [Rhodovulum steppense]|uniref:Sodium:alanine symporter family protein n=1 Tax=Rhodovulum steppense TaxID=540251 RepID=A0A4R1YP41_9RHOB|nr:alanine:cation symporter family protein [Rhodovulum steppense]TCM79675.1 sodium:alanine symporter family protein [Rhodovulum steppense]
MDSTPGRARPNTEHTGNNCCLQGNTVAGAAQESLGLDRLWTGIGLAVITGLVVHGGIKRIAKVADVIIPVMAIGYLAMALFIVLINITEVPGMIWQIVANAFDWQEAVGGGMGAAISQGLRRGLFSNEAGLGSPSWSARRSGWSNPSKIWASRSIPSRSCSNSPCRSSQILGKYGFSANWRSREWCSDWHFLSVSRTAAKKDSNPKNSLSVQGFGGVSVGEK